VAAAAWAVWASDPHAHSEIIEGRLRAAFFFGEWHGCLVEHDPENHALKLRPGGWTADFRIVLEQ
jgi:hypothetical protein